MVKEPLRRVRSGPGGQRYNRRRRDVEPDIGSEAVLRGAVTVFESLGIKYCAEEVPGRRQFYRERETWWILSAMRRPR